MSDPIDENLAALDEANRLFETQVPDSEKRVESEVFCTDCRHVHKPSESHVK